MDTLVATDTLLTLTGHLPGPARYALADLQRLPRHELGATAIQCFSGRPVAELQSLRGIRLVDVLAHAGFCEAPRAELKRCVIIGHGQDDYQAIFSWSELFNSPLGDAALIVYEQNGEPLAGHLGPLSLISAADRRLGPRNLRQLHTIEARRL
ncbi:molybdopterin-dependent oxidoreductase [Pelomonas sp. KK5]|uniref:molybdopterin-dependent oxidoreductase n=1 Tax=Pelomonas sp. KK5 TaxID=1855730 RepID=UPI00097BE0DC|nr:molybdopterin-dependent oxidoreductase [Pelomonas sp. KK5]